MGNRLGPWRGHVALLLLLIAPSAVLAHHGFGGRYDRAAPIYLEGFVETAHFGYPHAELTLRIDPDAQTATRSESAAEFLDGLRFWDGDLPPVVAVEFPPVRLFFSLEERVRVGDRIAVIALRNCDPPHQLRGQWVGPATGDPVVRRGTTQEETRGC